MDGHNPSVLPETSSPSSEGAASHNSTPDTMFTSFSSNDTHDGPKGIANGGIKVLLPPAFTLQGTPTRSNSNYETARSTSLGTQDPFTASSNVITLPSISSVELKLSPTATSFTPSAASSGPASSGNSQSSSFPIYQLSNGTSAVSSLIATSVPDNTANTTKFKKSLVSTGLTSALSPIGPRTTTTSVCLAGSQEPTKVRGESSRLLMISQIAATTTPKDLTDMFSDIPIPAHVVLSDLNTAGIIYLRYTDLREAEKAFSRLKDTRMDWIMQYMRAKQFVLKYQPQIFLSTSDYEGQVGLSAAFYGPRQRFDSNGIAHLIKKLLQNCGELKSFEIAFSCFPRMIFKSEFFDTEAANVAVAQLNGHKVQGCCISIVHHTPDIVSHHPSPDRNKGPLIIGHEDLGSDNASGFALAGSFGTLDLDSPTSKTTLCYPGLSPTSSSSPYTQDYEEYYTASPSGQDSPTYSDTGFRQSQYNSSPTDLYPRFEMHIGPWTGFGPGVVGQERAVPSLRPARSNPVVQQQSPIPRSGARHHNDYSSSHHNVVDVERIRQGLDVRTTIMLRNIPNRIDQGMLKDIVDETSRGKYDFMYLRIDFANNCNVGYAFINFEDPWYIIDFVNTRAGHRWNRFNSDKVAEVSYATIQGKDCLVQKFRNSSVMLEHPSFRPKIFHTGTHASAGEEDIFPGPDNPSKMRRSVENAEHVGLFAPRAGQHFRDEQRRRRSQYDRGTRLAEMEDAHDFEDYERQGKPSPHHLGPTLQSYGSYIGGLRDF